MKAKIYVTLKKSVLDPQGKTVKHALESLGFGAVEDVRMGKYIEVKLNQKNRGQAEAEVKKMCDQLLANTVIEEYRYDIE